MRDVREIRAIALGAVVVGAYLCLVLMSGRVDLVQFGKLFLVYVSGSVSLWMAVGTVALSVHVVRRARPSGSEPFLSALSANRSKRAGIGTVAWAFFGRRSSFPR